MLYKRCDNCGKRLAIGEECSCFNKAKDKAKATAESQRQAEYDRTKRNQKSAKVYHSQKWKDLKNIAIRRYMGIDIYSYYVLDKLEYGRVVHHICPIKDYPELQYNLDNLIYLTDKNHELVHKRMDNGETMTVIKDLKALVKRWKNDRKGDNKSD